MDPPPADGVLTRTTEHCLMGIRGTVRRSTDGWFVHCNIDTDVILWEGDPTGKRTILRTSLSDDTDNATAIKTPFVNLQRCILS